MTATTFADAAAWSYGFALVLYAGLAIRMALGWRRSSRAIALLLAVLSTAIWAGACIYVAMVRDAKALLLANVAETVRYAGWLGFVLTLLHTAGSADSVPDRSPGRRWLFIAPVVALIASNALSDVFPLAALLGWSGRVAFGVQLGLAVLGLALIEQLYRRTQAQSRWMIKPLCFALMGLFGYDLFFYADAMLFARIDLDMAADPGGAVLPRHRLPEPDGLARRPDRVGDAQPARSRR